MTNIEKIRQEVERRKKVYLTKNGFPKGTFGAIKIETYEGLLAFIDSLPEEKPSYVTDSPGDPGNPGEPGISDLEEAIKPDFSGCVLDSTKFALLGKAVDNSLLEPHIETMRRQIERKIAELPPAPEGYRYAWEVENYIKEGDAFTVTSNIVLKPILDPEQDATRRK